MYIYIYTHPHTHTHTQAPTRPRPHPHTHTHTRATPHTLIGICRALRMFVCYLTMSLTPSGSSRATWCEEHEKNATILKTETASFKQVRNLVVTDLTM